MPLPPTSSPPSQTDRRVQLGVLFAYALQAVALAIAVAVTGASTALPVVAALGTSAEPVEVAISSVDLGWALVVVLAGGVLTHAAVARSRRPEHTLLVAGWSQGSAILVFLVAQVNGITALSSLVPLYALAAGAVALTGIDTRERAVWQRPAAWAAVIGIVPWGVIAFVQIGSTIAAGEPSIAVRILTLIALAGAVTGWMIGWRRPGWLRPVDVVVMTAGASVAVWAIAVPMLLGAL